MEFDDAGMGGEGVGEGVGAAGACWIRRSIKVSIRLTILVDAWTTESMERVLVGVGADGVVEERGFLASPAILRVW